MKIVAEDKAVETRTNDFLNDWERSKPVEGHLRPDEALQHLQMYESKFARLKEERDNVAKAKEALELQEPGKVVHLNVYCSSSCNQNQADLLLLLWCYSPLCALVSLMILLHKSLNQADIKYLIYVHTVPEAYFSSFTLC
jgi:hypothetical protein